MTKKRTNKAVRLIKFLNSWWEWSRKKKMEPWKIINSFVSGNSQVIWVNYPREDEKQSYRGVCVCVCVCKYAYVQPIGMRGLKSQQRLPGPRPMWSVKPGKVEKDAMKRITKRNVIQSSESITSSKDTHHAKIQEDVTIIWMNPKHWQN